MSNKTDRQEILYPIGVVAQMFNISVSTLRLYESEGLIIPLKSQGNHRYFTESDIKRLECIRDFIENKGLNIAGIRMMLSTIPCWELKPCSEEDRRKCPAYLDSQDPCWVIKSETSACQEDDCRSCPVYAQTDQCTGIKYILHKYWRTRIDEK